MRWSIGKRISIGFLAAIIAVIVIGINSYTNTTDLVEDINMVSHTHIAITLSNRILSNLIDTETGQRGFLITEVEEYLEPYYSGLLLVDRGIDNLFEHTSDNPNQISRINILKTLVKIKTDELERTISLRRKPETGFVEAQEVVLSNEGKDIMDSIRVVISDIIGEENRLLAEREEIYSKKVNSSAIEIAVSLISSFIIMIIVGTYITRRITSRLSEIVEISEKVSQGEYKNKVTNISNDELGKLGTAINKMTYNLSRNQEHILLQNEMLKSKNEDLLIIDKMKSEFVSAASHELRTPLTSIKGSLGLLKSGDVPEEQQIQFIDICYNNTNRLIRLVNDFLDLSKLENQSIEFVKDYFNLDVLILETISEMDQFAKSKSKKIDYSRSNTLELFASRDRISQILVNLLSNAIKFSEGEKVYVSSDENSKFITIYVDDTSKIINKHLREKLFEPFVQDTNMMKRKNTGTGLGLAICKSIVDQHGGKIWIEENGTVGNRFAFTIPVE